MTKAVQWSARVLAKRMVSGQVALTLSDPGAPVGTRPGQYVAIAVGGPDSSTLLRRTAWISAADDRVLPGGVLDVVASGAGSGGRWLSQLQRGDVVDAIGPLGRPFSLPREPVNCLLVGAGSGAGSAALLSLGHTLTARGCRVEFVLVSTSPSPYGLLDARRISAATHVVNASTTEPKEIGSLVARHIADGDPDVVYLSGSPSEIAAAVAGVARSGTQQQCVLDLTDVCGTGVCAGCAIPVCGNDGITRMLRICTEGPVFNVDLVRWQSLQEVPDDCAGARAVGGQVQ
jgi:dihydroorotate dehydrogenase electron transfer subunit